MRADLRTEEASMIADATMREGLPKSPPPAHRAARSAQPPARVAADAERPYTAAREGSEVEAGEDRRSRADASNAPASAEGNLSVAPTRLAAGDSVSDSCSATGEFTNFGGLFYLLPLFARLGVEKMPFGTAWLGLRLVLDHLARDEDDALRGLLPVMAVADVPAEFSLSWPEGAVAGTEAQWRNVMVMFDRTGRLPLRAVTCHDRSHPQPDAAYPQIARDREGGATSSIPQFPSTIHPAAAALALGAHRICRKLTRLGLRALVRRPGRLSMTRTHVDVFLRLADVDPRIRRAALDADPGWVPWLGRAIAFHYTLDE
jgi:hypothetical protein